MNPEFSVAQLLELAVLLLLTARASLTDLQVVKTTMLCAQFVETSLSGLLHVERTAIVVQIVEIHFLKASLLEITRPV